MFNKTGYYNLSCYYKALHGNTIIYSMRVNFNILNLYWNIFPPEQLAELDLEKILNLAIFICSLEHCSNAIGTDAITFLSLA